VLPGVLMCEAAAQLCSYYTRRYDLLGADLVGFGGLDEVRFRDVVVPGCRLVIVCELLKARRGALVACRFQEFVDRALVCEGQMKGIPLPVDKISAGASSAQG
jgi:3-hydroxyacyl-[acyl-carrier-protein] dehydratase